MRAVFVKLGGSLITDKSSPMKANPQAIAQICQELAEAYQKQSDVRWFIGNGAGSFGHHMVHQTGWKEDRHNMLSVAQIRRATADLNRMVYEELLQRDVPVVVFPAASYMQIQQGTVQTAADAVLDYVRQGAVASVYGDVIMDDREGTAIASTEMILEQLAKPWKAAGHQVDSFIYCTSVDGVLDADGAAMPQLHQGQIGDFITGSEHPDVTGGMLQKVQAGFSNLRYTDYVYIVNGLKKGELTKALQHRSAGTRLVTSDAQ